VWCVRKGEARGCHRAVCVSLQSSPSAAVTRYPPVTRPPFPPPPVLTTTPTATRLLPCEARGLRPAGLAGLVVRARPPQAPTAPDAHGATCGGGGAKKGRGMFDEASSRDPLSPLPISHALSFPAPFPCPAPTLPAPHPHPIGARYLQPQIVRPRGAPVRPAVREAAGECPHDRASFAPNLSCTATFPPASRVLRRPSASQARRGRAGGTHCMPGRKGVRGSPTSGAGEARHSAR
jgi:hypothetical protein